MDKTFCGQPTELDLRELEGRYELFEEVGRGAMGVVYRARHRLLDREVAVKVCLPAAASDRFLREGQLLARLRSDHIVGVHDFDRFPDGRLVLVMDWVNGTDLAKVIANAAGPVLESRTRVWMRHVCIGMQQAAEQGIVHRDLKPSNILIDSADRALVADFGLARSLDAGRTTLTSDLMGTPHYMSPEQVDDPHDVGTRADIYSFGATFYHAVTGRTPFQAESVFSIMFKHKVEPLISPRTYNPDLSRHLCECIERCLAKSPQERYATFQDILSNLDGSDAETSPWDEPLDQALQKYVDDYHQRRAAYLSEDGYPVDPHHYQLPQNRFVVIERGDLVRQEVDAVVSSDDGRLSMGGGVSWALRNAGGSEIWRMAQQFAPVCPGRAVVTTAGDLPARFVFHGITMGYSRGKQNQWIHPSRDLIHEILESCFYHADTLGVRSIAFPLLGTGVGGFAPDICLDTMFRYLLRKLSRGSTAVREARIILHDERCFS